MTQGDYFDQDRLDTMVQFILELLKKLYLLRTI